MAGVTFNITNFDEAFKKLDKFSVNIQKEVKNEIAASALKIQSDAKRAAPVYLGKLRQSIYMYEINEGKKFAYKVGTNESYAPYIEFGTGGKVSVSGEYSSYASQFKGKGGGKLKDMIKALTQWVERKGLASGKNAKSVAYAIAISILRRGLRPQPFLFPAYEMEKSKLKARLKNIINNVKS